MKQHIFGKFFIVCIVIIAIVNVVSPKQIKSLHENRNLAQRPSFSLTTFLNGSFQKAYSTYVNDQFYQRDTMREVKNMVEKTLQIRQIEDVYRGMNNHLIQVQEPADQAYIETIATLMNTFADTYKDINMTSIVVPNKGTIQKENNPKNAPIYDQSSDISLLQDKLISFQTIDAMRVLSAHKEKELYYKSDHHWTTFAAYTMFQSYLEKQDIEEIVEYEPILINDRFYGTLANASGINVYDDLYLYKAIDNQTQSIVNYVEEQKKTATVYDMEKQYSHNPYEVFLSGNHALVEITTTSEQDRKLLVIKDSYANALLPFLLPYYHHISVVDPRYYYEDLSQLIRLNGFDEVLFLYNANTFFSDTSLMNLLQEE